jgi:hypothetical protein
MTLFAGVECRFAKCHCAECRGAQKGLPGANTLTPVLLGCKSISDELNINLFLDLFLHCQSLSYCHLVIEDSNCDKYVCKILPPCEFLQQKETVLFASVPSKEPMQVHYQLVVDAAIDI